MASLMELIDRVNKGEIIDPAQLEIYQESTNSAEQFLAHHAHAMLDLRRAQQHMMHSLEAIDYSDQKVLNQFISVSGFLGLTDLRAAPVVKFGACAIGRREYSLGLEAIQNGVAYDVQQGGTWTADRENCQFIATQYERAAQNIGWTNRQSMEWNNKQTRLAVVVSGIGDDDASGKFVRSLLLSRCPAFQTANIQHRSRRATGQATFRTECLRRRQRQTRRRNAGRTCKAENHRLDRWRRWRCRFVG